ncbi:MAG: WD40/YVTN/BNR-like repeat-containing protein, partial [Cyclobacteriaceae bacterium]
MIKRLHILLLLLALSPIVILAQAPPSSQVIKKMQWRAVGPANMGGRVTDIVGVPGDASTFYFAGADGGVFKTTNGGVTFEPQFTDQKSYSVGALALAPSNTEVVWLGSGEGDPRNSVGYGHGVYRSVDGGKTWKHLGLEKTERIKRIVVDPNDPDVACVCALGREWGPNTDRGVFLTRDAGKNWEKVLYIDENTGCSDVAMEWSNPKVLYAGMWTFRRKPWRFDDGGGNSGVYRSMDGGKTWEKIMKGLPNKPMARMGLSVAQSQPNIVYLITEFKDLSGTLFRSEDRGSNWKMINADPNLNFRPFYYSDVRVDPSNPDHLYTLSGRLSKSTDGGRTFKFIAGDVHGDHQALWIDPANGKHVLSGSDGGYQVSYDAGETWDIINNVELSQFYQMLVDNKDPYNLYGGLQDKGTWVGPSNSMIEAGIMKRHWT